MVYPYNGHPSWTNHRCEKLAQSFYAVVPGQDSNPRPLDRESDALPLHHDATIGSALFYDYYNIYNIDSDLLSTIYNS